MYTYINTIQLQHRHSLTISQYPTSPQRSQQKYYLLTMLKQINTADDVIQYVVCCQVQFINISFVAWCSTMKSYILLILIAVLTMQVNTQILRLFRLTLEIDDDCWVLDTNNLTEIGMGNCQDEIYYVNLGLGTPPSFANFQIDIQRDVIWFPLNETYVNESETFEITNRTAVTYMHRSIYEGSLGSDIVTVQSTNISTRSLIVWTNKSLDLPKLPEIGGILGMGYSSIPNFLDNAAQNNQIQSSIFALQMGGFGEPSVLYYNQLPSFLEISNIYVPVTGSELWEVEIFNMKVGGYDYSNVATKRMLIDTTTNMMYVNPKLYNLVMTKFFASCKIDASNKPICPCTGNWPQIQLVFQDVSIEISQESYFKKQEEGCILLIGRTLNEQSPTMIGGSLMRNYIITFDKQNKQVGFNGNSLGAWRHLFLIFQLIMIFLILAGLGIGIYLIMNVRYIKQEKLEKRAKKAKRSKKSSSGREKLLQMTSQFLQP